MFTRHRVLQMSVLFNDFVPDVFQSCCAIELYSGLANNVKRMVLWMTERHLSPSTLLSGKLFCKVVHFQSCSSDLLECSTFM